MGVGRTNRLNVHGIEWKGKERGLSLLPFASSMREYFFLSGNVSLAGVSCLSSLQHPFREYTSSLHIT